MRFSFIVEDCSILASLLAQCTQYMYTTIATSRCHQAHLCYASSKNRNCVTAYTSSAAGAETKSEIDANFVGQKRRPTQRQPKKSDGSFSPPLPPSLPHPWPKLEYSRPGNFSLSGLRLRLGLLRAKTSSMFISGQFPNLLPAAGIRKCKRGRSAARRVCPLLIHQQSKQPQLAYRERTADQLLPFFPPNILLLLRVLLTRRNCSAPRFCLVKRLANTSTGG